jgi:hypothetical protein
LDTRPLDPESAELGFTCGRIAAVIMLAAWQKISPEFVRI